MGIVIGDLKLFTIKELSEQLGITEITLRSYASKGIINARYIGGRYYISEDSLREYFNSPEAKEPTEKTSKRGRPKKIKIIGE